LLNFSTFTFSSKPSKFVLEKDIITKCNTVFTYLNNTNITTAHPWEVSCGALNKPSALSYNPTLSTIHRNLFMVTIPPMVVCGLRFSTIITEVH
jgi:hypothetical protein